MLTALRIFCGLTGLAAIAVGFLSLTVVPAAPLYNHLGDLDPQGVAYLAIVALIPAGFAIFGGCLAPWNK